MPSPAQYPSPVSSPGSHGGDMDPNEVRLRQAQVQSASISSGIGSGVSPNPSHGGDMDPNEVRLRQGNGQQASGPSVQTSAPASHGTGGPPSTIYLPQSYTPPAPYGSTAYLMSTPTSPPSGHQGSPSPRSQQSPYSGQYFPPQTGPPSSISNQVQQSSWTPRPGFQAQASLSSRSIESTGLIVKGQRKCFNGSSSLSAEPSITAKHLGWAVLSDPRC